MLTDKQIFTALKRYSQKCLKLDADLTRKLAKQIAYDLDRAILESLIENANR